MEKEWTIMVYMAGDNNLNDDMIRAINELREALKLQVMLYQEAVQLEVKTTSAY